MARVESCRFLRLGCPEDNHPLFRREYARNNRERGVKLLRCFPHCCPGHVKRSYCGCSVHVLVTFSTDTSEVPLDELLVCARFEPTRAATVWPAGVVHAARALGVSGDGDDDRGQVNKVKLGVGDMVELPISLLTTAERATDRGEVWVRAERESPVNERDFPKLWLLSPGFGQISCLRKNTALYVLNSRVPPKWFYNYDSSLTRVQREMTHHLVVYIFQAPVSVGALLQEQNQNAHGQEHPNVTVVARHASPGFFLVSYRRSGGAACEHPAVNVLDSEAGVSSEISSAEQQQLHQQRQQEHYILHQHHSQQQQEHQQQQHLPQQLQLQPRRPYTLQYYQSHQRSFRLSRIDYDECSSHDTIHPPGPSDTIDYDDALWQLEAEIREPGFRDKFKHLFILWAFLKHVLVSDLGFRADLVGGHIRSQWQLAIDALQVLTGSDAQLESVTTSLLNNILGCAARSAAVNDDPNLFSVRDQVTLQVSVHLFLRALASCAVQHLLLSAYQPRRRVEERHEQQERFVPLVIDMYNVLNDVLREVCSNADGYTEGAAYRYPDRSIPALIDDILSIVYGRAPFGVLRGEVSAVLLGLDGKMASSSLSSALDRAFKLFVEQASASAGAYYFHQEYPVCSSSGAVPLSGWNRRWSLEPGSLHVTYSASRANFNTNGIGVLPLALLAREVGCIDLDLFGGGTRYMSVRSALGFACNTPTTPMQVILDGRLRACRVLPSGISSSIARCFSDWVLGDYDAVISDRGQGIEIRMFAFADRIASTMEEHVSTNGDESSLVTTVRRIRFCLTFEQEIGPDEHLGPSNRTDQFIALCGTVSRSTYKEPGGSVVSSPSLLSQMSSTERGAIWNKLEWTPLLDFRCDYIAI